MPLNPTPTTQQSATATLVQAALRAGLLATVELLKRCRAADIGEGYIDAYVALNWLEWNGGGLRLTETGRNICRQLKDSTVAQAAAPLVAGAAVVMDAAAAGSANVSVGSDSASALTKGPARH